MYKFDKGDKVQIRLKGHISDGLIGEVLMIYPAGLFHSEVLYQVDYGINQTGQFTEGQLEEA